MLKKLKLRNFRCFENHEIDFSSFDVLVGKNNVGKSTVVDALKLVSSVCRYAPYRDYHLEDKDIPFSVTNLRHDYAEEEASIVAGFSDEIKVGVFFPYEDRPHFEVEIGDQRIGDRRLLKKLLTSTLGVIPPVGAFEESERPITKQYLSSVMFSHLTAQHFRNIWYHFSDGFDEFRNLLIATWPKYDIQLPKYVFETDALCMFFTENGITREVFWAGHGFQVWLQLLTSLVKLGKVDTLILDEPDIYLHSDMQKKLVSICKERSNQLIIATHAVDIIEEVQTEDIICVDKDSKKSRRLSNIQELQSLITELGSLQNLRLVHYLRGKNCLFVEGADFKYLRILAGKLGYQAFAREDGFSVIPLEGFSNWDRLMPLNWIFTNILGEQVRSYVLLDRDYHSEHETSVVVDSLTKKGVRAYVWCRKEIENYAIEYSPLYRMFKLKFAERHGNKNLPLTEDEFKRMLFELMEELKKDVLANIIVRETSAPADKSLAHSTIVGQVLTDFERDWAQSEFRKSVVSGKDFFNKLNRKLNADYKISISLAYAFFSLRQDEIAPEIGTVLHDIMTYINRLR
jgi:AAA15 family ATPase/GTPase